MQAIYACAAVMAATLMVEPIGAQPSPARHDAAAMATATGTEPITIKTGNSSISGTIETPAGNGQHGGIVIVAPSGKHGECAKVMAKAFAARGLVALAFDETTPNAADAQAALNVLRLRGDVRRDQIGVVTLGSASALLAELSKADGVTYEVAVRPSTDAVSASELTDLRKLSEPVLVVMAVADPFSQDTEKMSKSVQKGARNVTFWASSSDDVNEVGSANSTLLGRITDWAAARAE